MLNNITKILDNKPKYLLKTETKLTNEKSIEKESQLTNLNETPLDLLLQYKGYSERIYTVLYILIVDHYIQLLCVHTQEYTSAKDICEAKSNLIFFFWKTQQIDFKILIWYWCICEPIFFKVPCKIETGPHPMQCRI